MAKARHESTPKYPNIRVKLVGQDSNALSIVARVVQEMRSAGIDQKDIAAYTSEATSGDYDRLLRTTMRWVRAS
jgi:hypothetical protein